MLSDTSNTPPNRMLDLFPKPPSFPDYEPAPPMWHYPAPVAPVKCPVCEGRGNVPAGFYSRSEGITTITNEVCRTCNGSGIIYPVPQCTTTNSATL